MRNEHRNDYESWLWGQVLLFYLLASALAMFVAYPSLQAVHQLPELRLFLDSTVALASGLVALLAGVRFAVEGRRLDLLLCGGFFVLAGGTLAFSVVSKFDGDAIATATAWSGVASQLLGGSLIAAAPFARGRMPERSRAIGGVVVALLLVLLVVWAGAGAIAGALPSVHADQPALLTVATALKVLLSLVAVIGFNWRFRARGEDLDRWLALTSGLWLFAELHLVLTPTMSPELVSQGDFLRLLGYGVLLVGVWRAIRSAEFGRAVAEERARVAREIHDGLAQYLFAVSTHVSMLETGTARENTIPRLKEAAAAAQQEARFAVLALSSASGNAPFDAALRRYVEFLTADGVLEVDLEISSDVRLGPDEQIEVFRIVQEGLANVRKHANARRAEVRIGETFGRRFVRVDDDGEGFSETDGAGQGLKNIRARAASIGGAFAVSSRPGAGTALEVTLRA